jgi:hypothetical protein
MTDSLVDDNPFAAEAEQRWPQQYAQSQSRYEALSVAARREIQDRHQDIAEQLGHLKRSGASADSSEVQEQIDRHYEWVCNFWTPTGEAYIGLGQMYVDDERFAATYEKVSEGLADFIRRAILHYAASNLT